jgi:hypothetical protein
VWLKEFGHKQKMHSNTEGIGERLSGICVGIFHFIPYTMRYEKEKYLGKVRMKMKGKGKRDLLKLFSLHFSSKYSILIRSNDSDNPVVSTTQMSCAMLTT